MIEVDGVNSGTNLIIYPRFKEYIQYILYILYLKKYVRC